MPHLVIQGKLPETYSVRITCNQQVQTLYSMDSELAFSLPEAEPVSITIETEPEENNHTPKCILLFGLTAIFQGILNILLQNVESNWWETANVYQLHATGHLDLAQQSTLSFTLSEPEWSKEKKTWLHPRFTSSPEADFSVTWEKYPMGVTNAFFRYIKAFFSCLFLLELVLFVVFLENVQEHSSGTGILMAFIVGILILACCVHAKHHQIYRKLQKNFSD